MFRPVYISDPWERAAVRLADLATAPLGWRKASASPVVARVLLMRLERIGDLVMTLDGIAHLRQTFATAEIDLAVGSWNARLASLIPGVNRVETVDLPWLARDGRRAPWRQLISSALAWRERDYDLVVNFEPDIRSNFLAWLSGGRRRIGYWTAGGGAFLTDAIAYQPALHVATNAVTLARVAAGSPPLADATVLTQTARLEPLEDARRAAASVLSGRSRPLIGIHPSGGRPIKQWPPDRFRALARKLCADHGGTIVLTGEEGDRDLVREIRAGLPDEHVVEACGTLDLVGLTALLEQLDVLVTADTGPLHLAHAVAVPTVSIFGPSDPARYAPSGAQHRVVRVDLPCSPCNRIRRPPARCMEGTPECLLGIPVELVSAAVDDVLQAGARTGESRWTRARE